MLKLRKDILFLLAVMIIYSFAVVTIVAIAGEDPPVVPLGQFQGTVYYDAGEGCEDGDDSIFLYDSLLQNRITSKAVQGGGSKFWYNCLIPPNDSVTAHYYIRGDGEECGSTTYYVLFIPDEVTTQNVVFDMPNMIEGGGD